MATMIGDFNDGSVAGKVQFGQRGGFNQKGGTTKQLKSLKQYGPAK